MANYEKLPYLTSLAKIVLGKDNTQLNASLFKTVDNRLKPVFQCLSVKIARLP